MIIISTKSHLRNSTPPSGFHFVPPERITAGFLRYYLLPEFFVFPAASGYALASPSWTQYVPRPTCLSRSDLPARGRLRYSQHTNTHCITQPTILLPSAPSPRPRTQLARIPALHPLPCTIAPPCVALMTALELRSYLFAY
jgi:hypothetical protein